MPKKKTIKKGRKSTKPIKTNEKTSQKLKGNKVQ
jgi:hypothetical protein